MTTKETLERHVNAFIARDVGAMLQNYAADAVLLTPDGPLRGHEMIKAFLGTLTKKMVPPGAQLDVLRQDTEGTVAFTVWRGSGPQFNILMATDTLLIEDGSIRCHTFCAQIQPKTG
jgi:hypothetical protein